MAYKEVTSGLTNVNAVINEILTFLTTDLAAPWTTETNKFPAAANVANTSTSTTCRNTWVSMVPAQPNGIAHKGILSPDPDRMYIGFRGTSTGGGGVQLNGTGFHDAAASPVGNWWGGQGSFLQATSVDNIFSPNTQPYVDLEGAGPYTKLYLFGPNQVSPLDVTIPNYCYFVVEFSPSRFAHGYFGEMKKITPFEGGWGYSGHAHDNDTVDNLNNKTMWNERRNATPGDMWIAANVGQVNKAGAGGPTRWFKNRWALTDTGPINIPYAMRQWGHIQHRDFMIGPSQATLSGFYPLVQPLVWLLDSDSTAGKNIDSPNQIRMPACYPEDFFLGDITSFEPGVTVTVGGIDVVPFPITSKLGTTPRSNYGGYFYRKRV